MNGDDERNFSTVLRFGSLTELSEPLRTGRPKPDAPIRLWTLRLSMYPRNWAHAGCGAFHEQA